MKLSAICETEFHYKDKIRPINYVVQLAMNMQVNKMINHEVFCGYFLLQNCLLNMNAYIKLKFWFECLWKMDLVIQKVSVALMIFRINFLLFYLCWGWVSEASENGSKFVLFVGWCAEVIFCCSNRIAIVFDSHTFRCFLFTCLGLNTATWFLHLYMWNWVCRM